ncbi:MAG: AMP-binding protein [Clostridiales bacterium]|nr:AMP-binding protein [Clostridiales bacterium]
MKMYFNSEFGKTLGREIVRALLERSQSIDTKKMMRLMGSIDPLAYEDVEESLNVAYVNRTETALAMDIFRPKREEHVELPVIILIHGGGLFMGDRGLDRNYCRLLAHKGYLTFSLEYRLAPKATFDQQLDDVCAGMDLVGRHLVDYDIDFGRIFLVADSAGAYLSCYVAAMNESEKLRNAIGEKPTRMVFAALGFVTGMFSTQKILQEQLSGEKREDQRYRKYMTPEHPEILGNLPPCCLITSRGDPLNTSSFQFHKALRKAGKVSRLIYFGDEELQHIFPLVNPLHPKSLQATEKMIAFFEEQAGIRRESMTVTPEETEKKQRIEARIADGSISNQKVWSNIRERIAWSRALLKRTAIIDCTREYTYQEMFDEWERYARVFSALEIGADSKSRVALCGTITAEPLFALYALNMTGAEVSMFSYPDFLPNGMWMDMIEKEKITDLIISDIMVSAEVWKNICAIREKCGLRHVILVHSLMGGPAIGPAEMIYNEYNYHMLRSRPEVVFMGDLLEKYRNTPIRYDQSTGERLAFLTHTSGTTKGTRKVLPFTDKIFNDTQNMFKNGMHSFLKEEDRDKILRVIQLFDFSSIMALSAQINLPLCSGDTLVLTFFGFMHQKFIRAIDYYNVNVLFVTGFMIDKWIERTDLDDLDLSSLRIVGTAGGYISPEKMEAYEGFFREHGFRYKIMAGYGMSEAGGKPMFAPDDHKKDVLGFADEPENIRIRDENDGKYYRISDGPRTGLLYKVSDTRCNNELDGEVLFNYTEIDGRDFLCTNDLVQVNEDGSLSFAGRADKYFVNNSGRKFDSGVVDQHMSAHSAIHQCAVVPIMDKRIHDTVPVFYVIPAMKDRGPAAAESIRQAFVDVYVREKKISAENLPTQFMLVDEIPLNANGKIDIYRITRERLKGSAYDLVPVLADGALVDIQTKFVPELNSIAAGTLPQGMENNSAYNVFDLFNTPSGASTKKADNPFGLLERLLTPPKMAPATLRLPDRLDPAMKTLLKYGSRLTELANFKKSYDFDFED